MLCALTNLGFLFECDKIFDAAAMVAMRQRLPLKFNAPPTESYSTGVWAKYPLSRPMRFAIAAVPGHGARPRRTGISRRLQAWFDSFLRGMINATMPHPCVPERARWAVATHAAPTVATVEHQP